LCFVRHFQQFIDIMTRYYCYLVLIILINTNVEIVISSCVSLHETLQTVITAGLTMVIGISLPVINSKHNVDLTLLNLIGKQSFNTMAFFQLSQSDLMNITNETLIPLLNYTLKLAPTNSKLSKKVSALLFSSTGWLQRVIKRFRTSNETLTVHFREIDLYRIQYL